MSQTLKSEWVDWQNTKVLQKAAVVDEAGNFLAIKRTSNGPASRSGKWDLPGGSIGAEDLLDNDKPNEVAITRELMEETGLEVKELIPVFIDSWMFNRSIGKILGIALGYKAKVSGIKPSITLSREHTESLWGTKDEILQLDFGDDGGLHSAIIHKG
jgi:8-oxo-dGTP pyrophosphatase MutT (NUDIX family)